MSLPAFKYHPDPIKTGSIVRSDRPCECCGKSNGYIYDASIYSSDDTIDICPWCIADGTAAKKLKAIFSDDRALTAAGIDNAIVAEICQRTPGYNSWQQEEWQSHCQDGCEFHGDASTTELEALSGEALEYFLAQAAIEEKFWQETILKNYQPGGNPAIYKFVCRHCRQAIYTIDWM